MVDLQDASVSVHATSHGTRQLTGATTFGDTLTIAIRAASRLRR